MDWQLLIHVAAVGNIFDIMKTAMIDGNVSFIGSLSTHQEFRSQYAL